MQSRFGALKHHAQGGLGAVYRAVDRELMPGVAVKFIHAHLAAVPETRDRFFLEARITGMLDHLGVVPIYGTGETQNGRPFYAMKFVEGDTLARAIATLLHPATPDNRSANARIP